MKILIISNVYYPVINPRAFRWTTIAELWAAKNHTVDVLTSWRPGLAQHENINGIAVYRPGKSAFQSLRVGLLSVAEKKGVSGENAHPSFLKRLSRGALPLIKKVSDYTWKKIHWPDCECLWFMPAVRKARSLVSANDYDVIYSVSTPFTSHLVGLKAKSLCPTAKWVVDIGDPFSYHTAEHQNNYVMYNRLNFYIERKVFLSADGISVTTQGTLDNYVSYFPSCKNKIRVIPPLISFPENFHEKKRPFFGKGERIRLLFVGNFYRPVRRPTFLLTVFSLLQETELRDKLELHIMGSVKNVMDFIAPFNHLISSGRIVLHGVIEHHRALKAMTEADVLVNIGNDTSYQLPSKIVDYMAAGKSIVNLAAIEQDSSTRALEDYPHSFTLVDNNVTGKSPEFIKLVDFLRELPKPLDKGEVKKIIHPYIKEAVSEEYLSMVR